MKFLAILGIGFGVGMLGGLLIVWLDHWRGTPKAPEDADPGTMADSQC